VDTGRSQQRIGQGGGAARLLKVGVAAFDDFSDQRITVGMGAGRGQAQQHVADVHTAAVDQLVALDDADGKAGEVVIAMLVHAGHFRGFAANQCGAGQFAAAGDAVDHGFGHVDVEFAGGVIIKEKQRFGTLHQNVVYAHGHQVDADRVVPVQLHGQFQLG